MSMNLAVGNTAQVKQYGLLSLPASQSAHTARNPWMPSFTLLATALTASDSLIYNLSFTIQCFSSHPERLTTSATKSSELQFRNLQCVAVWTLTTDINKYFSYAPEKKLNMVTKKTEIRHFQRFLCAILTSQFTHIYSYTLKAHTQLLNFLTGNLIIFCVPIALFPPVLLASAQNRAGLCASPRLFVLAHRHL